MSKPTQAQIEAARMAYLNALSKGEDYALIQAITAAAEAKPTYKTWADADREDRNITIERCAQVAEQYNDGVAQRYGICAEIAAAIRALA